MLPLILRGSARAAWVDTATYHRPGNALATVVCRMTQVAENDNCGAHREIVLDLGNDSPTIADVAQRLRALADVLTVGGRVDFDWRIRKQLDRELLARFIADSKAAGVRLREQAALLRGVAERARLHRLVLAH